MQNIKVRLAHGPQTDAKKKNCTTGDEVADSLDVVLKVLARLVRRLERIQNVAVGGAEGLHDGFRFINELFSLSLAAGGLVTNFLQLGELLLDGLVTLMDVKF